LVVPVKLKKEVVGLLVVVRKASTPFSPSNRTLLEAVADYASISLVNASLFRALEERAKSLQQSVESALASERKKDEILDSLKNQLTQPLDNSIKTLDALLISENTRLNSTQKSVLRSALENLQNVSGIIETLKRKE